MGKKYCVVCSNYTGKKVGERVVSLHRLPADRKLNRAWRQRLKLIIKDLNGVTDNTRVCSEHFVNKQGPRTGDDVPSVFQHKTFKISKVCMCLSVITNYG